MLDITYLANKSSIINSLPLFSDLSFFQKRYIAAKSEVTEIKKGTLIYKEGDPPDYFYCMINGRVEIYHPADKAKRLKEQRIEYIRRGEYFGSISALTGQSHTVSTRALNDSTLLRIDVKSFNQILRKIPKLAIFLSHSLSRRLSGKPFKDIFESKIIAIHSLYDSDLSPYARALEKTLKKESGKKVIVVTADSIPDKKEIASKLSLFTGDYHYVLVEVAPGLTDFSLEVLGQADICHVLSPSDKDSLRKTSALIKKLQALPGKYEGQSVSVILKEDRFYARMSYKEKYDILSKEIFATLPQSGTGYEKTIRRIAREISGVRVGLVLGSGSAMGFAHIGVLGVLEKEKIPVDIISATSIGALIAALWAAGFSAAEIEKFACTFRNKLRTLFLIDPTLPVRGLIKGRTVRSILKPYIGNKTFLDLKVPLRIVACDIKNRSEYIIDRGKLIDAVMASIAIPGVFEPVEYEKGIQLVDGGIINPLPVSVLSREGINRIIAVNTLPSPKDIVRISQKKLNIYDIIVNSFQAMEYSIATYACLEADVHINPIPELADWYEFYKAKLFIKTGHDHAKDALPQLKNLARRRFA